MKNNIRINVKKKVEENRKTKKKVASFTLSGASLICLDKEAQRLNTNRSFLLEMIIQNYMDYPILNSNKKEGGDNKK